MEPLEISNHSLDDLLPPSNLYDSQNDPRLRDEDLDELLNLPVTSVLKKTQESKSCCYNYCKKCRNPFQLRRLGKFIILNSTIYERSQSKWCIVGPHWYGFLITCTILSGASYHYINKAWKDVGPISTVICVILTMIATITLFVVGFSDPGIVRKVRVDATDVTVVRGPDGKGEYQGVLTQEESGGGGGDEEGEDGWRYCAFCNLYQPPNAAHCSECSACIDGFHHHCFWMGKCIGKKNLKHFQYFNLTWMVYFIYATIWISLIGPRI